MRETPQAAQAFEDYYDLGDDRSLRALAKKRLEDMRVRQKSAKSTPKEATLLRQFQDWSTEHKWQERVIERDRQRAEAKRKKREAEIDKMDERQAAIGTTQQATAIKLIQELIKGKEFNAHNAIQLLKLAINVERVARGAPTDHKKEEHVGDGGGPIEFEIELVGKSPDENEE
jgi:hypothetical protein